MWINKQTKLTRFLNPEKIKQFVLKKTCGIFNYVLKITFDVRIFPFMG